jgi:hypothetical protein
VGYLHDPKYHYKLGVTNQRPIQQQPIKLGPKEEAWTDTYLDDLLSKDVIVPIEPHEATPFVTGIFLVP